MSDSKLQEPVVGEACDLEAVTTAPADAPGIPGSVEARPEVEGESVSRLAFTPAAIALIDRLWEMHGPLMFHQSGGCCDGSAPMCYREGQFRTGGQDVLLGTLELPPLAATGDGADRAEGAAREIGFWMSREQFEVWSHTHLTIDAVPGRGGGFSLEAPEGLRFLIRSRLL
ncbi:DUF779 domain-containing protein [Leucobacter soli]|uniref:DUF779 domain-containing protein n=1 Tax=Leucobacter soli TaxID=2812850 RepID=A0A916JT26_9MICO|nr:DUF779 domain-containing protein [Leucobacter soli]CAG7598778.1 hypothetical protein LEUCIP111803_00256 [Leucobacter soli]